MSWIKYNDAPQNENAYGRTYTDIRTGETLCAYVGIFSGMDSILRQWYLTQTGNVGPMPDDVYMAMLEMVLTHEIGHTLGLEHNFYGSRLFSTGQLRDSTLMSEVSHGSTIMDYMRLNYAALPEDGIRQADLVPCTGPYDNAAIAWGYGNPSSSFAAYMFSREELRYLPQIPSDPQTLADDLGSDPLGTAEIGMMHLKSAMDRRGEYIRTPEDSAFFYSSIMRQYYRYIDNAVTFIGGFERLPDDDGNIRAQPVDSAVQAQAQSFIDRFVYNPPDWAEWIVDDASREYIRTKINKRHIKSSAREYSGRDRREASRPESFLEDRIMEACDSLVAAAGASFMETSPDELQLYSENGKLILDSGEGGNITVYAHLDSGAGLKARPLHSISFPGDGTADITGLLYGMLYDDTLKTRYRLSSPVQCDVFSNATITCAEPVADMSMNPGHIPVQISFLITKNFPESKKASWLKKQGKIVLMADEMPESLRQTVEKCLGAYNYRHHTKLVLQDMEDRNTISADCRFAVSCDILGKDVDIHEENGFFRLNIGLWK